MKYYSIQLGLSQDLSQQELIDLLRNQGADVIQTSDGVALKSAKSASELQNSHAKLSSLKFEVIDPQALARNQEAATDLKAFVLS